VVLGWYFGAIIEEFIDDPAQAKHLDPKRFVRRGRVIRMRRILLAGRDNETSRHVIMVDKIKQTIRGAGVAIDLRNSRGATWNFDGCIAATIM